MTNQVLLVVKNPPASAGDTKDASLISGSGRSPGEGNGNPLQYSCLENPIDRGAWPATVHEVTESQTQQTTPDLSNTPTFLASVFTVRTDTEIPDEAQEGFMALSAKEESSRLCGRLGQRVQWGSNILPWPQRYLALRVIGTAFWKYWWAFCRKVFYLYLHNGAESQLCVKPLFILNTFQSLLWLWRQALILWMPNREELVSIGPQ